jgi:predicted dehydrogenase
MRRLAIGVIGAGGIARRKTIPGMLEAENCSLRAVMDVTGIADIAAEFRADKAYEAVNELLKDPEIEAVYIASPVFLHHDQVIAAAEHQKHILCEKPLARTVNEAESMIAACRAYNVFLQEGYMMTFHGAHRKIREIIDGGALGKIVSMRAQLSCWYPPIPNAWRQRREAGGGGALIDLATHLYGLLEYFAGPIHRVGALIGNLVHDYESEDASTSLLEFQTGAHATVDCFYCIPDEASRSMLEIYGSQGSVIAEGTIGQGSGGTVAGVLSLGPSAYDAAQNKGAADRFQPIPFDVVNPYTAECEYFADCILKGKAPEINTADDGLHILRLTEAAYASAKDGRLMEVT